MPATRRFTRRPPDGPAASGEGRFPRRLVSEFGIAGLLLGFQRGLTSGSLGGLRIGQRGSLASFNG